MSFAVPAFTGHDYRAHEDHVVVLEGATWADYERLLEIRGDRSTPRIAFNRGVLEIMSPSRSHESIKSLIGRLVEVFCFARGVPFTTLGSWTLKNPDEEKGAEPDECYVFGRGHGVGKRPDLAIEVVWTWGRIDKLAIYRDLGVREVWYWRDGKLQPYVLRDGRYHPVEQSEVLPGIDLALLVSFMDRETTSDAVQDYRSALDP